MLATENRRRRERPAVVRDLAERLGFEPSLDDFLALDAYILLRDPATGTRTASGASPAITLPGSC